MPAQGFLVKMSELRFWIIVIGIALVILFTPIPERIPPSEERSFRVEASQFAFSPAILKVNRGDQITIELVSQDVVHGLAVDGYGYEISADPGQPKSLTFTANKSGSFRIRCSVTCGNMHPFMIGKLQVGRNDLLWRGIGLSVLAVVSAAWRGLS